MKTGKHCTMILLAGGQGKRMGTDTAKQYLELGGKPVLQYSLEAVEQSEVIDDCILVVRPEDRPFVRDVLLAGNRFEKVVAIANSGRERSESVWNGLKMLHELFGGCEQGSGFPDVVYIHDGARPFLDEKMICDCFGDVMKYRACTIGYPSRDTIKVVDENGVVVRTPDRKTLWAVQTPQVFEGELIFEAYRRLFEETADPMAEGVTDDASVAERFGLVPVHMTVGSVRNIKLTTPEDLVIARAFLEDRN